VAGGCREEDVDDWSVCIDSAATIPVARLVDIWLPLCMLLSGESARPIGYPRAETPLEKDPQTLTYRDCPRT